MNNNLTTAKTLSNLNINENTLKEFHKKDLLEKGYCLIHLTDNEWRERSIDLEIVSKVIDDLTLKEGWKGGWDHRREDMQSGQHPEKGAQRLNNLIMKHEQFRKLITLPESLAASNMLMKDEIALSQIISRMPFQGEGEQAWHIDWVPRKKFNDPIMSVLTFICLDDFNRENGATRVIPGSHKFLKAPDSENLYFQDHPDQVYIEAKKGTLFICDVNLWHAGSKNLNGKKRRYVNIAYRNRKIWQHLNYKKELTQDFIKSLSPEEAYLLKVRNEDSERNDWAYKNRNNFFVKKFYNILWSFK